MRKPRQRSNSSAEHKTLIPTNQNRTSGVKDRFRHECKRGWLGQLKAALKLWELRQVYPHLRKGSNERRGATQVKLILSIQPNENQ